MINLCVSAVVEVDLYNCAVHDVGSLLKKFLREIPGSTLLSSLYTEYVSTNNFDDQKRVNYLKR